MLTRKNKMTKIFSILHLFHDKFESFFNLCGTNPEIQYHNVVIPQFYHTPKYTKARMGTTQYNTIVKKNCTIVLYLRLCEKTIVKFNHMVQLVPQVNITLARNSRIFVTTMIICMKNWLKLTS